MPAADSPPPNSSPEESSRRLARRYWRSNLGIMAVLLSIWAAVSLGCGILLADALNAYSLPGTGYPLGFWFAQQGSIATFVVLILIYCVLLNRLDARHHANLAAATPDAGTGSTPKTEDPA